MLALGVGKVPLDSHPSNKIELTLQLTASKTREVAVVIHEIATGRSGTAHIATAGLGRTFYLPKSLGDLAVCLLLLNHGSDKGIVVPHATKRTFWTVEVDVGTDTRWWRIIRKRPFHRSSWSGPPTAALKARKSRHIRWKRTARQSSFPADPAASTRLKTR